MLAKERKDKYREVFGTPDGIDVLNDLMKQHYMFNTTYNRDSSEYETVYREGQRKVVLRILNLIKDKENV